MQPLLVDLLIFAPSHYFPPITLRVLTFNQCAFVVLADDLSGFVLVYDNCKMDDSDESKAANNGSKSETDNSKPEQTADDKHATATDCCTVSYSETLSYAMSQRQVLHHLGHA